MEVRFFIVVGFDCKGDDGENTSHGKGKLRGFFEMFGSFASE